MKINNRDFEKQETIEDVFDKEEVEEIRQEIRESKDYINTEMKKIDFETKGNGMIVIFSKGEYTDNLIMGAMDIDNVIASYCSGLGHIINHCQKIGMKDKQIVNLCLSGLNAVFKNAGLLDLLQNMVNQEE